MAAPLVKIRPTHHLIEAPTCALLVKSNLSGKLRQAKQSLAPAKEPMMTKTPIQAPDPGLAENARLRNAIDKGETKDKVAAVDPAMAPLGTDDEAAQLHDEEGLRIARAAKKPPAK